MPERACSPRSCSDPATLCPCSTAPGCLPVWTRSGQITRFTSAQSLTLIFLTTWEGLTQRWNCFRTLFRSFTAQIRPVLQHPGSQGESLLLTKHYLGPHGSSQVSSDSLNQCPDNCVQVWPDSHSDHQERRRRSWSTTARPLSQLASRKENPSINSLHLYNIIALSTKAQITEISC